MWFKRIFTEGFRESIRVENEKKIKAGVKDPTQRIVEGSTRSERETTARVAKAFNTNRQYISDARKIKTESKEDAEKIRRGELTISQYNKRKQARETIEKIKSQGVILPEGKFNNLVVSPHSKNKHRLTNFEKCVRFLAHRIGLLSIALKNN